MLDDFYNTKNQLLKTQQELTEAQKTISQNNSNIETIVKNSEEANRKIKDMMRQ
jgi:hypothetical protein